MFPLLLSPCVFVFLWIINFQHSTASLVSGGKEVIPPFKYPWMVSISHMSSEHKCGGVLISNQFVLTAAHCLSVGPYKERDPPTDLQGYLLDKAHVKGFHIRLGVHNLKHPLVIANVKTIKKHPSFCIATSVMDIALIKLAYKVPFSEFISPICLPHDSSLDALRTGIVAGWGETKQGMVEDLVEGTTTIWSNDECLRHRNAVVAPSLLCAGGTDGPNICNGDSGGPLFVGVNNRYYVIGITSMGSKCKTLDPNLYTRVSLFIEWITMNSDYTGEFCGIIKYPVK